MVTIRRAKPEDNRTIAMLWMEMISDHIDRDPRFEVNEDAEETYAEYARGMLDNPDTAVFLAEEEGESVGYVLALVLDNPPVFQLGRYGFVGEMVVTCKHRRGGIGRMLWDRARRWFKRKGVSVVQLNVSESNLEGKAFWKSVGFEDFLEVKWCELDREGET